MREGGAPGGLELPTFWFVAVRPILPNLARGVANRTDSASWGISVQSAFSFFFRSLRRNCWYFPHVALRFRDSCHSGPFRRFTTTSNASIRTRSRARSITASAFLLASTTHLMPFGLDLLDACDAKLPFERRRRKNQINPPIGSAQSAEGSIHQSGSLCLDTEQPPLERLERSPTPSRRSALVLLVA